MANKIEEAFESFKAWVSKEFGGKLEADALADLHAETDKVKSQVVAVAQDAGADLKADAGDVASDASTLAAEAGTDATSSS